MTAGDSSALFADSRWMSVVVGRECVPLVESLYNNRSLTKLDISNNRLCEEETLNFLHPEFTTGRIDTR
jgi:hypothetical protein